MLEFLNFLKILMVWDKTICKAKLEFIKLYKQNPLEILCLFFPLSAKCIWSFLINYILAKYDFKGKIQNSAD